MSKKPTTLVIGGDGLLGSHLVRQLVELGHEVRVVVHPRSASPTLEGLPVEILPADLTSQDDRIEQAVRGARFVFHCAAITDLWAAPGLIWKVNLEGTRRVLDACMDLGVQRLVFTGSASSFEYGSREDPGDERGGFPESHERVDYMASKHQATELVRRYVEERGLDAVIVAPTFLLGDLDWRPSSGELIRQFIKRRMQFTSPGGRCFAHTPDVARAMVAALTKGEKGRSYLAGGHNLSYMEFFTRVAEIAGGLKPPRVVLPGKAVLAAGAVGSLYGRFTSRRVPLDLMAAKLSLAGSYYSSARAVAELGMPQTPVETAIEDSIRSLRTFGHI